LIINKLIVENIRQSMTSQIVLSNAFPTDTLAFQRDVINVMLFMKINK